MFSELLVEALLIVTIVAGLPLLSALVVGLTISVFQAATQVSEQTLTFVPKLITIVLVLVVCWPWTASLFDDFMEKLFHSMIEVSQGTII